MADSPGNPDRDVSRVRHVREPGDNVVMFVKICFYIVLGLCLLFIVGIWDAGK